MNTAPILSSTQFDLKRIDEDAPPPVGAVGDLVSSFVALGRNVTDANTGAVTGIAVTYASVNLGTWWYSTNNGATWNILGAVSNQNARLLAADVNTRVYFQPNRDYADTGNIRFRAWDQTTGSNGGTANTTINGGSSAFSSTEGSAVVVVNPINDAPVIVPNQSFGIPQNRSNGTIIGTLRATDVDNPRVSNWQIVGGNIDRDGDGNAAFRIDPSSGQITINDVDDLEPQTNPRINLQVKVSDGTTTSVNENVTVKFALQAGDLDANFGNGGIVITPISANEYDYVKSAVIQSDGKILALGTAVNSGTNGDIALVRYNRDGSLDTNFGIGGKIIVTFGTNIDNGQTVLLQPDGKIIVAGVTNGPQGSDFILMRYSKDGVLDRSFGNNGQVIAGVDSRANEWLTSAAIQPDGKIVLAVHARNSPNYLNNYVLLRYNSDGSRDTTFGSAGIIRHKEDFGTINSIAIQQDGRIVVAGSTIVGGKTQFAVARYTASGILDTSFGSGGRVITSMNNDYDLLYSLAIGSDGKIVVAGRTGNNFALARYNSDGSLDIGFGNAGKVITPAGYRTSEVINSLAIQADGKIVVGGSSRNNNEDFAIARYNSDGSLDSSFNGGKVLTKIRTSNDNDGPDGVASIAIDSNGDIIAAGSSNGDFTLLRYKGNSDAVSVLPTVSFRATDTIAAETTPATNIGTYNISRTNTSGALAVKLSISNNSRASLSDYNFRTSSGSFSISNSILTVVIPDGVKSVNLNLIPVDDTLQEDAETVILTLLGDSSYARDITASNGTITIEASDYRNTAPVNNVPLTQIILEDQELLFSRANSNRITISDADAFEQPIQVTLTTTNGTLTIGDTGGLSFGVGDGIADTTMTFTNSLAGINIALNTLRFNPTANFNGNASIQIVTNDLGNTGIGGALIDRDIINISVASVNDIPLLSTALIDQVMNEDSIYSFDIPRNAFVDADGDSLIYGASLSDGSALPTWLRLNGTKFTATPTANLSNVSLDIKVTASDAKGGFASDIFNLAINNVNDAPVLNFASNLTLAAINEDDINNQGTLVSDIVQFAGRSLITDLDTGAIRGIAVTSVNNNSGIWQYSIDKGTNWSNFNVFSFSATLLQDTARIRFLPRDNFNGTVFSGISFRAWDGADSRANGSTGVNPGFGGGTSAFSINTVSASTNVTPVNDAPIVQANRSVTVNEDAFNTPLNITRPSDVDNDSLTVTVNSIPDATKGKIYFANGFSEVTSGQRLTADQISGLIFRPVVNANGDAGSFSYTVSDGRLSNSQTINFNINPVNDAPTFKMGASQSVGTGMGRLTFKDWASNINLGANETLQSIQSTHIQVLNNSHIFKEIPSLNPVTGDLTYTPVDKISVGATATIRAMIRDNGGTQNGGVDTSQLQTFTITVLNTTNNSITINGRSDAETLTGTDFNDLIYAYSGDDTIIGGLGNDQIWGHDGNDEIWGGLGNDILRGGFGRDTFGIHLGQGTDTIMDFRLGEDLVAGASGLRFDSLLITQQGRDTLIRDRTTNESLAILSGISASSITRNSFITIA